MSLLCPDCLVYGVWEAGKTMRDYATPISTSDTGKVAPKGQHYYAQVLAMSDDKEVFDTTNEFHYKIYYSLSRPTQKLLCYLFSNITHPPVQYILNVQ